MKADMKKVLYLLRNYPLTLLCLLLVWFLSLTTVIPETPMDDVPFIDKWTHFVMYGGTCAVMWFEYLRHHDRLVGWKLWLFAIIGPVLMGGLIELLQKYATTTRSGEWADFLADSIGVFIGAGIGLLMNRYHFHRVQ